MELKTKIRAVENSQELFITREFDLSVELLFMAFTLPEIVEQWMGTKVLKLLCTRHGSYQFETTDPKGNIHGFNGVIHDCIPNQKIIRTFEMENSIFGVQLEFLEFKETEVGKSELRMHVIYQSIEHRDQMLKLPFAQGINMAHNRLQNILSKQN
ncbi:MAG: SRPBCC domain-containing protein [Saprospiraceae bacterium]